MEQFKAQIVDKFPLALDDSAVIEIAEAMGWTQAWMFPPKAKAPRPVVSGDPCTCILLMVFISSDFLVFFFSMYALVIHVGRHSNNLVTSWL